MKRLELRHLVPYRSLCSKLPVEIFNKTLLIWFHSPLTGLWSVLPRPRHDYAPAYYYPAPVAEEFIEASEKGTVMSDDKGWEPPESRFKVDNYSEGIGCVHGEGRTLATALCKCYLKKLETKEKK